jgi:hypothetical protein
VFSDLEVHQTRNDISFQTLEPKCGRQGTFDAANTIQKSISEPALCKKKIIRSSVAKGKLILWCCVFFVFYRTENKDYLQKMSKLELCESEAQFDSQITEPI